MTRPSVNKSSNFRKHDDNGLCVSIYLCVIGIPKKSRCHPIILGAPVLDLPTTIHTHLKSFLLFSIDLREDSFTMGVVQRLETKEQLAFFVVGENVEV